MDNAHITAIKRLFNTDDGKILLEFLERSYLYGRIHSENMAREVGQRDVVLHIRHILEKKA